MRKVKKSIFCESCESEYDINFMEASVRGPVVNCPFCGDVIEEDYTEDEIEEDEIVIEDEEE